MTINNSILRQYEALFKELTINIRMLAGAVGWLNQILSNKLVV